MGYIPSDWSATALLDADTDPFLRRFTVKGFEPNKWTSYVGVLSARADLADLNTNDTITLAAGTSPVEGPIGFEAGRDGADLPYPDLLYLDSDRASLGTDMDFAVDLGTAAPFSPVFTETFIPVWKEATDWLYSTSGLSIDPTGYSFAGRGTLDSGMDP